ncbi:hypothetical protein GGX14DRAFT_557779 [Mycena pura]|uniref:Uncharacterized protein n=1 Tax=Mycena pura TaxID=153505 RepID=A0AAD6YLN2_9AGAR|nr:hypothetical protein GGX14DRAFT_557779 [Mycena pura]
MDDVNIFKLFLEASQCELTSFRGHIPWFRLEFQLDSWTSLLDTLPLVQKLELEIEELGEPSGLSPSLKVVTALLPRLPRLEEVWIRATSQIEPKNLNTQWPVQRSAERLDYFHLHSILSSMRLRAFKLAIQTFDIPGLFIEEPHYSDLSSWCPTAAEEILLQDLMARGVDFVLRMDADPSRGLNHSVIHFPRNKRIGKCNIKTAKQPRIQPANSPLDRPAMPSSPPPMAPPAHSSRKRGHHSCLDSAPSTPKKARAGSDVMAMGDSDREDAHDERESEDGDVTDDFDFEDPTGDWEPDKIIRLMLRVEKIREERNWLKDMIRLYTDGLQLAEAALQSTKAKLFTAEAKLDALRDILRESKDGGVTDSDSDDYLDSDREDATMRMATSLTNSKPPLVSYRDWEPMGNVLDYMFLLEESREERDRLKDTFRLTEDALHSTEAELHSTKAKLLTAETKLEALAKEILR